MEACFYTSTKRQPVDCVARRRDNSSSKEKHAIQHRLTPAREKNIVNVAGRQRLILLKRCQHGAVCHNDGSGDWRRRIRLQIDVLFSLRWMIFKLGRSRPEWAFCATFEPSRRRRQLRRSIAPAEGTAAPQKRTAAPNKGRRPRV
jgi:hypothetical protein